MNRLKYSLLVAAAYGLAAALLPAYATAQSHSENGSTAVDAERLRIGGGDVLSIQVFNTPELSEQVRVGESGAILLPVGGAVQVRGLTARDAASAVEAQLKSQGIMLDPRVTITITEFATEGITVAGEVKSPGIYTLMGNHTLYDLLSAAGGPTATEGPSITITHKGDEQHAEVLQVHSAQFSDTAAHTHVYPGDTVFVAKAGMVYVVGDVIRSGAFIMQDGQHTTVLTSLALAGGVNATAAMKKAEIVRESPQGVLVVKVNLKDVFKHKSPDLALNSGDILVVPGSGVKEFASKALPGMSMGVTNAVADALILQ